MPAPRSKLPSLSIPCLPAGPQDKTVPRVPRSTRYPATAPFLLLLLLNCYLPILLIWCGIIPFAYRFHVLAAVLCSFVLFGLYRGYGLSELGLTLKHSLTVHFSGEKYPTQCPAAIDPTNRYIT